MSSAMTTGTTVTTPIPTTVAAGTVTGTNAANGRSVASGTPTAGGTGIAIPVRKAGTGLTAVGALVSILRKKGAGETRGHVLQRQVGIGRSRNLDRLGAAPVPFCAWQWMH